MYKLFFIARNNMRKQKGDMITFFILTLFAAFLIFDAVSAVSGLEKVLDDRFAETNGAEMLLLTGDSEEERECAKRAMTENAHVADYEATPVTNITFRYRNAKDAEWDEYQFLIESAETEKRYMTNHLGDEALQAGEILMPRNTQGRFAVGDTLQLKTGNDVYEFRVAGYAEEPYFCSTMNITEYYVYMTQGDVDRILDGHPELAGSRMTLNKAVLDKNADDGYSALDLEKDVTDRYKELIAPYSVQNPDRDYLSYMAVNWLNMRGGSSFLPMLVCGIVLLFAVIIVVISVIIISFSIRNFIRRSMKDTGVLEAGGYTVRELRGAMTMQIGLIALTGSAAGVLLAIATFGAFGSVVSGILGLAWNQPVNIPAAAITVLVLTGLMILDTRWISRRFNRFSVLDALRGGISTHNYRKNRCSLEKTKLPLPAALSMKDALGNPGRNAVLAVIACILTISTLMGFGMYENFGKNPDRLIGIMGFEDGEIAVNGGPELGDDLRKLDGVVNVLGSYGFEPTYRLGDREITAYTYAVDDMANTKHTILTGGRMERNDNEIMLTTALARDLNASVGDVVTVNFGVTSAEYLVTGTNQRMERMGKTGYMTFEGAKRLVPNLTMAGWYVTGEEGVTYDDLKAQVDRLAEEKGEPLATVDIRKNMEGTIDALSGAMKALCIGIALLTVLIVIFVEALIIRAKIIREWRGMGISKALGMTSGGLIVQIMLSSIPAILAGILAGTLLSQPVGSRLCVAMLSFFGMEKIKFGIPAGYMAATAAIILAVALATAGLLGLKVRRINPVEMITEE